MSMFVLDTDHYSLFQHGSAEVARRVRSIPSEQLAITIITAEEQLTGWYTQVRKARDPEKLAHAYEGLFSIVESLKRMSVLPYTSAAIRRHVQLRKSLRRIGTHDLAIAASVLEVDGILVTRNLNDFEKVPQLRIEDWSKS